MQTVFIILITILVTWNCILSKSILFLKDQSNLISTSSSLQTVESLSSTTISSLVNNTQIIQSNNETEQIKLNQIIEPDTEAVELQNETCSNSDEEFVSPVRGKPRCCRKCAIGDGMLRLCTNLEDTQCRSCKSGSEFSPVRSATKKCMQCRQCKEFHPLARTRTACTPTTDTVCECEKLYYISEKEQTCKPCSICKPGEGVVKACDWNSDTECQACPTGFWSAQTIDNVKCIPCQICRRYEIMVKSCSSESDTICCPATDPNCTYSKNLYFNYPDYDKDLHGGERVNSQNQMLPIYCSFMGLIIVSLLGYVIYKLWKQREAMAAAKLNESFSIGVTSYEKDSGLGGLDHYGCGQSSVVVNQYKQKHNKLNYSPVSIMNCTTDSVQQSQEQEKEPLINNLIHANNNNNFDNILNLELNKLPTTYLAIITKCLTKSGVCGTPTFIKLKPKQSDMSKLNPTTIELLQCTAMDESAMRNQKLDREINNRLANIINNNNDDGKHFDNDLKTTCYLVQHLCEQAITIGTLYSYLKDANRPDLVDLFKTIFNNHNHNNSNEHKPG